MKLRRTSRALAIIGTALAGLAGTGPAGAAAGGTVEHWGGFGNGGQVADVELSPAAISLPSPAVQVSSSNSTQYALLGNGTVYAWGVGRYGSLGNGHLSDSFTTAVKVKFPAGVKIAFLPTDAMPFDTAFAVDTTGQAWGWGDNAGGELCLGNTTRYTTPVKLPFAHVTTLDGGAGHASYDNKGTLYSCGKNGDGQLGDGTTTSSTTPVQVSGLSGANVTELVGAWGNQGALLSSGKYFDWGYNGGGQLGEGTTGGFSDTPVRVPLPAAVSRVAQGGSVASNGQTLALLTNRALYAWGTDTSYQLGDGQTSTEPSPELITPPPGVTYKALATGGATSYGLSATGEVYAWGLNQYGQVGDGQTATATKPVAVLAGATQLSSTARDVVANLSG